MAKRPMRVFQIAKELNISHQEIMTFLKKKGEELSSHMSPVDEAVYHQILSEFAKDKEVVERYRKDQVRREIHETRLAEQIDSGKRMKILSLDEQRQIEDAEQVKVKQLEEEKAARIKEEAELARKVEEANKAEEERLAREKAEKEEQEAAALKAAEEEAAREESKKASEAAAKKSDPKSPAKEEKKPEKKADKPAPEGKRKLRKINLNEIDSKKGAKGKGKDKKKGKDQKVKPSVRDAVRRTLAGIDSRSKKKVYSKSKHSQKPGEEDEITILKVAEFASVDELSKIFAVPSNQIIQKCFALGILATINQRLDWDTIELLAEEFGFKAEKMTDVGEELFSLEDTEDDLENAESRSPVVTVMGHVDHGKTSILDYIRKANVVGGESGGITQHIGAYSVKTEEDKSITFLDTPGHEAFTAMRARGAQVTDIVILVVAANDAVMPQTVEAINHAKAANVPMVIAINKVDLNGIDVDRVKRELSEHNVLVEEWGGKVQSIEVSAKTGQGIDDLLAAVLIESEMLELKANRDTLARGTVVEARLDKGHGPIATVLIQKGTLEVGMPFLCNNFPGKVRAILDERGKRIKKAGPSDAVQILGFDQVPQAADIFAGVESERDLKRISSERQRLKREIDQKKISTQSLEMISAMIKEGDVRNLSLIIKGDVDGSVEALAQTLEKLNNDEVGIQIVHKAVGTVMESDVFLAATSSAIIIGFGVQVSSNAKLLAKQEGIEIRTYSIIYNVVEDIRMALEGLLEPDKVEQITGKALVQAQFKIPKIGFIAGCKVSEGLIKRGAEARLIRGGETIGSGQVSSLKRFKDDAREVKEGLECGIGLEGISKYQEGDIIESFEIKQIKRKLEAN